MFAQERQNKIEQLLEKNGAVTVKELMDIFTVSIETIRRDLLAMEKNNLLQRVHGGAVSACKTKPLKDLNYRLSENDKLKEELCATAVSFINEGDIIGMDVGSTAIYFTNELKKHFCNLTVITSSLDVFEELYKHKNFNVILCGGLYYEYEHAFYGTVTEDTLSRLNMQKCFIFPYAVSLKNGICDHLEKLCPLQKLLISNSDEVFILADSSKFEHRALYSVSETKSEYRYITDSEISEQITELYSESGISLITGKEEHL